MTNSNKLKVAKKKLRKIEVELNRLSPIVTRHNVLMRKYWKESDKIKQFINNIPGRVKHL